MTGEPDNVGLMRYYWKSAGPVLILEDQDGGMYCFYVGFDQYISESTYIENMMLALSKNRVSLEKSPLCLKVTIQSPPLDAGTIYTLLKSGSFCRLKSDAAM